MNDSTPLSPADAHATVPQGDLANDCGPSLAAAGDHNPSEQGDDPSTESPIAGRSGARSSFHSGTVSGLPAEEGPASPLEERLRRLEDALVQVQDPQQIENRIAQRVAERLANERTVPVAQIAPAAAAPPAPSITLPTGVILDVGKRIFTTTASLANTASTTDHPESALSNGVRRTILFFDMLTEARAIWCMYTDPRYKMSWAGRLVPLLLALFLLTSAFLVPGAQLTGIGTIIDKLADLIPAFILFKLLSYEARRYRMAAPDLPADLRL
jgi:hypothetical protein